MIVAKRKPFEEIKEMLKPYKKVLNVGCGTCVSVCLAGGQKEVQVLNSELEMARNLEDNPIEMGGVSVERQCDREFLAELDSMVDDYEAIMSMACGTSGSMYRLFRSIVQATPLSRRNCSVSLWSAASGDVLFSASTSEV